MKSHFFSVLSAAALFVAGVSAQLTINTPTNVISCVALQITFAGGTAPYIIRLVMFIYVDTVASNLIHVSIFSVHPGAAPNADALATFTNITGSPFTWTAVNFATGTSLDLTLRDSTGATAQSAPFTVQSGGSTSCLNGTATGSSGPAASTGASSPTTTGTTTGTTGTKAGAGSTGSSTAASPSSSGKNAAIVAGIPYSVAGVLGVVVAAVFV